MIRFSDPVPDDLFDVQRVRSGPAAYSEQASENVHVCTPERELKLVRSFASIGLDPASNPGSTVGASITWYGPVDSAPPAQRVDGLVASWSAIVYEGEIVFVNPPYGNYIVPWIGKMNAEAKEGVEIIALLPGRFDTKWFRAMQASRLCWYGRRIPFIDHSKPDQKDTAKFPSVFAYWGNRPARFEEIFGEHGTVTPWRKTSP